MKLSIIIPCFNEESTIIKIVNSVKASAIDIYEIIIVDDGSTDKTSQLLESINLDKVQIKRVDSDILDKLIDKGDKKETVISDKD